MTTPRSSETHRQLTQAILAHHHDELNRLLSEEKKANLNLIGDGDLTLLEQAIVINNLKAAKKLLDHGAYPHIRRPKHHREKHPPYLTQSRHQKQLNIFLVALAKEQKKYLTPLEETDQPIKDKGICNGLTFLWWRASACGDLNTHIVRILAIADWSQTHLENMAKLYAAYQKALRELHEEQAAITKTILSVEFKEINDREKREMLEQAKDLYIYISTLLFAQDRERQNLNGVFVEIPEKKIERRLQSSNYDDIYKMIAPDKDPGITPTNIYAFNFTVKELQIALETILHPGDQVRIGSEHLHVRNNHIAYLEVKNTSEGRIYAFYNSNYDNYILKTYTDKEILKLVEEIKISVLADNSSNTYLPFALWVSRPNNNPLPEHIHRKTAPELIDDILIARGTNSNIDAKAIDGTTTLEIASCLGELSTVKKLVEKKAEITPSVISLAGTTEIRDYLHSQQSFLKRHKKKIAKDTLVYGTLGTVLTAFGIAASIIMGPVGNLVTAADVLTAIGATFASPPVICGFVGIVLGVTITSALICKCGESKKLPSERPITFPKSEESKKKTLTTTYTDSSLRPLLEEAKRQMQEVKVDVFEEKKSANTSSYPPKIKTNTYRPRETDPLIATAGFLSLNY